jgi:hypothetical protein
VKKEDFSLEVPDGALTPSGERKFDERPMASNIIALKVRQASSRVPFPADREKHCDPRRRKLKHVIPKNDCLLLGLSVLRPKLFR